MSDGLGGDEGAADIDGEETIELFERRFLQIAAVTDAGVVDENIEPAELGGGVVDRLGDGGGVRRVGLEGDGLTAGVDDRFHDRVSRFLALGVRDRDGRAVGGQSLGDRRANAARTTRYQCHLA
ncbi:MAG: hypothetical protein QM754_09905 [Tepidisphaeraceae bacterium]